MSTCGQPVGGAACTAVAHRHDGLPGRQWFCHLQTSL